MYKSNREFRLYIQAIKKTYEGHKGLKDGEVNKESYSHYVYIHDGYFNDKLC